MKSSQNVVKTGSFYYRSKTGAVATNRSHKDLKTTYFTLVKSQTAMPDAQVTAVGDGCCFGGLFITRISWKLSAYLLSWLSTASFII